MHQVDPRHARVFVVQPAGDLQDGLSWFPADDHRVLLIQQLFHALLVGGVDPAPDHGHLPVGEADRIQALDLQPALQDAQVRVDRHGLFRLPLPTGQLRMLFTL